MRSEENVWKLSDRLRNGPVAELLEFCSVVFISNEQRMVSQLPCGNRNFGIAEVIHLLNVCSCPSADIPEGTNLEAEIQFGG